ncbi:transmembrane protease serine 3-like [Anastrepha obliqua]|uniref:transmembrane protease serine 3-like n=1 Tax=Anastrepha obliqua TaxID=95512 RepID=UPI00240994B3|nr:transmembrane protease serine 3-like [Anastrepha obliqua]
MHPLLVFVIAALPAHLVALISQNKKFIEAVSKLRESNETMNGDLPFAIPFHVSIQVHLGEEYYHLCGGSIIHSQIIMTAAHCFHESHPMAMLSVVAGVEKFSVAPKPRYAISLVVRHRYYWSLRRFDIALVKLKEPLPIDGTHIDTVDYRLTENMEDNKQAYLIVWDRNSTNLGIVDFTTINTNDCRKMGFVYVTKLVLCAYSTMGRGACEGDSGGALLSPDLTKQLGILSYGRMPCQSNRIYVYTSMVPVVGWIDEQIKRLVGK